ncbi:MAG: universal stress protein [Planctomycetaceae bacterium]|nr:universal stress protein [Planctomycetaceae bacterium]
MLGFHRILVGIDTTDGELAPATLAAWQQALSVAAATGAELLMITVSATPVAETEAILVEDDKALGTLEQLKTIHSQFQTEANERGVSTQSIFAHGRTWYEIIQTVLREQVELVVVGCRNQSRAERILFGSTAMKLLRKCPCPVWAVRPNAEEAIPTVLAADDFSETGEQVVHLAVDLARLFDGRLLAVHSVRFPLTGGLSRTGASQDEVDEYRQQVIADAEQQLQERLAHTDHRTIAGGFQMRVTTGPADLAIEELVRTEGVTLVVMGSLARAGVPGILLGNTAERLLPLLSCSVLAIKPEGFVSPITLQES